MPLCSVPGCPKLTQVGRHHALAQDGYTLERVDVYGLIDGVHETVVIPGAECYVGRNDNPSFSSCAPFLSIPHLPPFHISPPPDSSWFGAARRTFGYYLACRRSVGPEQGMSLSARSGGRALRRALVFGPTR
jgi:hypothetical protein